MSARRGRGRPRSSSSPDESTPGLFSGMTIYLSKTAGPDFTTARRSLLSKNVANHDGQIAESIDDRVTHIIQSSQVRSKDTAGADATKIYSPEWLVEALKQKKLPPPERHRWRPPAPSPDHCPVAELESPTRTEPSAPISPKDMPPVVSATNNSIVNHVLDKLASAEHALGNVYEGIAYERARNIVRTLPDVLQTEADVDRALKGRKGIGTKLLARIKEVVETGGSEKLDHLESSEKVKAVTTFMQIWGVGQKLALELYQKGCRTLDDVRTIESQLPSAVRKSLRVHEELQVKMPRNEVKQLSDVVGDTLHGMFQQTILTVCGSYRRNAAMCGDIDVLINPIGESDSKERYEILSKLVSRLTEIGFLTDNLAMPSPNKGEDDHFSYMGIAQLKRGSLHRRIDIKIYSEEHMPFALAYFTGDAQFVRKMRLHAKRSGYSLNDHGLYPVKREPQGKQKLGPSAICPTEQDIFRYLGIVWVKPADRTNATVKLVSKQSADAPASKKEIESTGRRREEDDGVQLEKKRKISNNTAANVDRVRPDFQFHASQKL